MCRDFIAHRYTGSKGEGMRARFAKYTLVDLTNAGFRF